MPDIFNKGHFPPVINAIVNMSYLLSWLTGSVRDTDSMKSRMRSGYNGEFSDHVTRYDETGSDHYEKIAEYLLNETDVRGKRVLDVGCGTGIASMRALRNGAAQVVSIDQSSYMLGQWKKKALASGFDKRMLEFRECDAEHLSFGGDEFDVVISSMVLGLVPNQVRVLQEMQRVLKTGGTIAVSTHGINHYLEGLLSASLALLMVCPFRIMGYRVEYWPWDEKIAIKKFSEAGLAGIAVQRKIWREEFDTPEKACDFYTSTSSQWHYAKLKDRECIDRVSRRVIDRFVKENIRSVTSDVLFCKGKKV